LIQEDTLREIFTLKKVNEEMKKAFVTLHGVTIIDKCVYLVMENLTYTFLDVEKLYGYLDFTQEKITFIRDTIYYLVKHLYFIHKCGILHSDIKPDNIMIDQDNMPRYIDPGISKFLANSASQELLDNYVCTEHTKAPDNLSPYKIRIYRNEVDINYEEHEIYPGRQDYTSDVFSLAQVIFSLIFPNQGIRTYIFFKGLLIYRRLGNEINYYVSEDRNIYILDLYFPSLYNLLCNMTQANSSDRYNSDQCMKHNFLLKFYKEDKDFLSLPYKENNVVMKYNLPVINLSLVAFFSPYETYFTKNEVMLKTGILHYEEDIHSTYINDTFPLSIVREVDKREFNQLFEWLCTEFLGRYPYHDLDVMINMVEMMKVELNKGTLTHISLYYFYDSFFQYYYIGDDIYNRYGSDIRDASLSLIKDKVFSFHPVKTHIYYLCHKLFYLSFTDEMVKYFIDLLSREAMKYFYYGHTLSFPTYQIIKNILVIELKKRQLPIPELESYIDDDVITSLILSQVDANLFISCLSKENDFRSFISEVMYYKDNGMDTLFSLPTENLTLSETYVNKRLYSLQDIFHLEDNEIKRILNENTSNLLNYNRRDKLYAVYNILYENNELNNKTKNFGKDEMFKSIFYNYEVNDIERLMNIDERDKSLRDFLLRLDTTISYQNKLLLFFALLILDNKYLVYDIISSYPHVFEKVYFYFFNIVEVNTDRLNMNMDFVNRLQENDTRVKMVFDFLMKEVDREKNERLIKAYKVLNNENKSNLLYTLHTFDNNSELDKMAIVMSFISGKENYFLWLQTMEKVKDSFATRAARLIYLLPQYISFQKKEEFFLLFNGEVKNMDIDISDYLLSDKETTLIYKFDSQHGTEDDLETLLISFFAFMKREKIEGDSVRKLLFALTSCDIDDLDIVNPYNSLVYTSLSTLLFTKETYEEIFKMTNIEAEFEKKEYISSYSFSTSSYKDDDIFIPSPPTGIRKNVVVDEDTQFMYNDDRS
jgi:serine/threonine protein kinase